MTTSNGSEYFVRALNTDNRRDVENLCELFNKRGVPAGYPASLAVPRAWSMINHRVRSRIVSITSGSLKDTVGHVALKTSVSRRSQPESDVELILSVGETAPIVERLRTSGSINCARSISFLGPKVVFDSGGFQQLGLILSATLSDSGWMYGVSPAKESTAKAMAFFVPTSIAKECEARYREFGLLRKRKHRGDSIEWALPADMPAVSALDRHAGLFAVNPSLITSASQLHKSAACILVNAFDPRAEEYIERLLESGFEFSGLVPRLSGLDYVVLSRSSVHNTRRVSSSKLERTGVS